MQFFGVRPDDSGAGGGACCARRQAQEHGQQEGTAADAEHQQRVLRPPRLHTQRAVRHQTVENQNAPAGHVLHWLPYDRAGQRRPGHGRFQSRPVRAHVQAVGSDATRAGREGPTTAGLYIKIQNLTYISYMVS